MPNAVRSLLTLLVVPSLAWSAGSARAAGAAAGDGIETARAVRQVVPGVRLESYERLEADRWLRIDELVVELGAGGGGGGGGVRAEYLGGHGAATVAQAAAAHPAGPGRRVVAAVNGDFFDARGTGAPLGPGIAAGRLLHSAGPGPGPARAVAFGADATGRIQRIGLDGRITLPGGAVRPLAGYNAARPPAAGFAAYTADWPGAALPAVSAAVTVRDGRVTADAPTWPRQAERPERRRRPGRPEPGTTLLTATGAAAVSELVALRPRDAVTVSARPLPKAGPAPVTALGGREPLVVAGVPQDHGGKANNTAAPRTAVGFSRDGRQLRILTVDGRQRDSGGLTLTGLGRLMHRNGAYEALNLDGGGSSTLLAAQAGAVAPTLENAPSDGFPRPVANGLVLTAPTGSGRPAGYRVEPTGGSTGDPALTRVFPGLSRTLTATGYDAALGPAAGEPAWSADGNGTIGPTGVFRAAARPGGATVHARHAQAQGELRLDVLGPLTRIRPTRPRIGLAVRGESSGFRLLGQDTQGASALVEPRDVVLRFDRSQWSVQDDGRGGFTVTALTPRATGTLRAVPRPPVGADPAGRSPTGPGRTGRSPAGAGPAGAGPADRGPADRGPTGAGRGGPDPARAGSAGPRAFGPGPAAARAAAGQPPAGTAAVAEVALGVGLATQPLAGLDDAAAWTGPGASPTDGHRGRGLALALPGPAGRGSAAPPRPLPVPELARSLTLWVGGDGSGARPTVELTDADGAAVSVPGPAVDWTGWRELTLPLPATAQPPLTVTRLSAVAADRPARLLLDTLGARTPPTARVTEPDAPRDPILTAEAAVRARSWRFAVEPAAPTTARTVGDAGLRADLVLTGAPRAPFVHRGVRFLTLDTTRRTLAGGGLSRLRALRTALAATAEDPDTGALAVVQRHAPQTVDRKEAVLSARLLAEFRRTTGKRAALFTVDAPALAVGRSEGVPAVALPAAAGRVLVGVDAFAAGDWLSVQEKTG
ncbi:phosphodiester glycosidase family protein [Streptomyces sp. NPDC127106]|uniref:phosphodiester glycosidase family protein n=1 Tax=Streptomyces sp. NPDC127106 TaxID=3345360 RepID=UPI00363231DE